MRCHELKTFVDEFPAQGRVEGGDAGWGTEALTSGPG